MKFTRTLAPAFGAFLVSLAVTAPGASAAPSTPHWIDGGIEYQSGTNCVIVGQPKTEPQVGTYTGYWGADDISYPKVGDIYWGHIVVSVVGNTCPHGIADVQTEIQLPAGTQLAVDPSSNDPGRKIRCFGGPIGGPTGELTGGEWVAPFNSNFRGKYCDATSVSQGPNGLLLGYRLLARGQTFEIVFPLRSTRKLSGIGEPNNASRMTGVMTSGVNTTASPFQWVFVGDRPVEPTCPAAGADAASAITNTTARTRNHMCNWYRGGKARIEIGEGASGAYQTTGPAYDVDAGNQAYYFEQDWSGLKPGTDYHYRLKFTDTKGTATTADDQVHFGQPQTFKTTGSPTSGTGGGPPKAGQGGSNGNGPNNSGDSKSGEQKDGRQDQEQREQDDVREPEDVLPPGVTAGFRRVKLGVLLKKGLRATVSCSEECTLSAQLKVDKKTARKLKLGKKATVIGRARSSAQAGGQATFAVKLTGKARKRLKRARSLKATLVVVAADARGNESRATKKVSLRR